MFGRLESATATPGVMIGNNHHQRPKPGEDFQMYERAEPSGEMRGALPVETCDVIYPNWFYSPHDKLIQTAEHPRFLM